MDDNQSATREARLKDLKAHAVAVFMLALSLVALYTHTLYLAVFPLLWIAFRAGREQGREQALEDIEQAKALGRVVPFPAPDETARLR